jgi:ferredoxin
MYEIVMSTGDRAECDSIAACLTAAETMFDDAYDAADPVQTRPTVTHTYLDDHDDYPPRVDYTLAGYLNRHLTETRPAVTA